MARDNAKTVRIDDATDEFIAHQAKQSYHDPATLMFIIIKEWCILHGIEDFIKEREANLSTKNK